MANCQSSDDDELRRALEDDEKERAGRSDAQWWEEDHLAGANSTALALALSQLVEGCGCDVGRLLSDLREIEQLSDGYRFFLDRREVPGIIRRARDLASDFERLETHPISQGISSEDRVLSERLSRYADAIERARQATTHSPRPQRADRIRAFIRYVDARIRVRRGIGKAGADAAMASLLTEVTYERWTSGALRMERSRVNRRLGRKRMKKVKRPVVRRLRGSRVKDRKSRFVSLDERLAAENGPDDELDGAWFEPPDDEPPTQD